jgi:hypothetical protein
MNMWVRQWIPVLRECFSNASHWVRRQIAVLRECFSNVSRLVRQQVLVMRELYANDSPFNKFLLLIGFIFILLSPIIGKYLSSLRKLTCDIVLTAGFEPQL